MKGKKEKKKNTINADKKSTNVNIKELVKKRFEKKKENFRYMMFEDFIMKNLNMRVSAKHHINNMTLFSKIIKNFSFELKNVSNEESDV